MSRLSREVAEAVYLRAARRARCAGQSGECAEREATINAWPYIIGVGVAAAIIVALSFALRWTNRPTRGDATFCCVAAIVCLILAGGAARYGSAWGFILMLVPAAVFAWAALGHVFEWPAFRQHETPDRRADADENGNDEDDV
jgi:ABC-type branched-subunit amino acid transport system permease subunit